LLRPGRAARRGGGPLGRRPDRRRSPALLTCRWARVKRPRAHRAANPQPHNERRDGAVRLRSPHPAPARAGRCEMTWFRIDDKLHDHPKVRKLRKDKLAALGLWTACGSWSADTLSDGFVPAEIVQRFDPTEQLAKRLVEVGLWVEDEQDDEEGYRFHQWTEHQPTRAEVERRRAEARERMRRRRAGRAAEQEQNSASSSQDVRANTEGTSDEVRHPDPTRPVPNKRETPSLSSSEIPPREDVERLCLHLANRVAENTGRRPVVTKRWHDAARLLLDKDLEGEPDPLGLAIRLVDWATSDEFWRSNILSLPKFREKFDQLRLRARQQWEQTHRARPPRRTTDDKVAAVGPLVEKVLGLNGSPTPRPELQAITGGRNW